MECLLFLPSSVSLSFQLIVGKDEVEYMDHDHSVVY